MRGQRHFPVINFSTGQVRTSYVDSKGRLVYKHQKMLARIDLLKSRLMQMDCWPKVKRRGMGLEDIRRRSVAQVFADAAILPDQLDKVKDDVFTILLQCGCVGLASSVLYPEASESGFGPPGLVHADLEVVHPSELLPFPHIGMDNTKQRGLIRRRPVPLSFLREFLSSKNRRLPANYAQKLRVKKVMFGEPFSTDSPGLAEDVEGLGSLFSSGGNAGGSMIIGAQGKETTEKTSQEYVIVEELWLDGPGNTVSRYIMKIGEWIAMDEDYKDVTYFPPIAFTRFINDGSFYGQGPADLLMPLNREVEKLFTKIFTDIRTTDRMGVVLLPSGWVDPKSMFHDTGIGLKYAMVDVQPWNNDFRPVVIQPQTQGDFPGRVSVMANQAMDEIMPMSDILHGDAPGRTDSAQALSFLDQQTNIPLIGAMSGIRKLFGSNYKYIVTEMTKAAQESNLQLPITRLTEDLVGVVIDPNTGSIIATRNLMPAPQKLEFTIADEQPRSAVSRKAEALELLKMQVQAPDQLRMLGFKEGLDFAIYAPAEEAAYHKTVLNIILIFNDGKTPGPVLDNRAAMVPHIQLQVLDAFMARPEFLMASPQVRQRFAEYKQVLLMAMGVGVPSPLEPPDMEAAMMSAMMQGSGMGPPGAGQNPGQTSPQMNNGQGNSGQRPSGQPGGGFPGG